MVILFSVLTFSSLPMGLSILFFQSNTSWIYLSIYQSFRQASMGVKLSELRIQVKDTVRFKDIRTSDECVCVYIYTFFFFNKTNNLLFWPHKTFRHCKLTLREGNLHSYVIYPLRE